LKLGIEVTFQNIFAEKLGSLFDEKETVSVIEIFLV